MSDDEDEESGDHVSPRGLDTGAQQRLQVAQAALEDHWDDVIADMRATVEAYEDRGWDADWTRPGDVTIVTDEEYGEMTPVFLVTVPDSGYEAAGKFVDGEYEVTETEIFRAATDEAIFLVVALRDEEAEQAFFFPMYYSLLEWLPEYADGPIYTRIRKIDDSYWEFEHDTPELFAPPESATEDDHEEIPGGPPEPPEPPEPPIEGRPVEDLSELTPEQLSELSTAELRAYSTSDFAELSDEQLAALDVPRGGVDSDDEN
jgi:hypothetical protein